jgi:hypothetical protein
MACVVLSLIGLLIVGAPMGVSDGHAAQPVIPVHAWWSIPAEYTSAERYRELAEAGFTTSMSPLPNVEAVTKALDAAGQAGVKLFITCPELSTDPEGTVRRFMSHPALAGYHLTDEPNVKVFPELAAWVRKIQAVDPGHPCYINLYPTYANETQLGTPTYQAHVDSFVAAVPVTFISFDHYPVMKSGLRPDWYENLEIISGAARKAGKPFWAFALAVAHDPYPIPTAAELRLEVFSDLAYGAQCIQYFTYWTPTSTQWNFHEGPIEKDGRKTPVYDLVREMNREIRALSRVFSGARVVSVGHTGSPIPRGTKPFAAFPPFREVRTEGQGAVVSRLEYGGATYLVVVNRDFQNPMPLAITLDPGAKVGRVNKEGNSVRVKGNRTRETVPPGDAAVFVTGE